MDFLHGPPAGARRLRELLAVGEVITAPGCYDGLSARLVEEAGFDVAYMTGFGTAAGLLGRPDVGLLTFTEMVDNVRRITQAIGIPLIADMDTGYGNAMNVIRAVQLYEQTGVAAFHIEDQVTPKKCGHMDNKQVVPLSEAVAKIRAAVAARQNPDTVIIARTDVRAIEGVAAAVDRAKAFHDAGADILFVEALQGEGIERFREAVAGQAPFARDRVVELRDCVEDEVGLIDDHVHHRDESDAEDSQPIAKVFHAPSFGTAAARLHRELNAPGKQWAISRAVRGPVRPGRIVLAVEPDRGLAVVLVWR